MDNMKKKKTMYEEIKDGDFLINDADVIDGTVVQDKDGNLVPAKKQSKKSEDSKS